MAQKYTDPLYDALDADVTAKLGLPSGLLSKIRLNGERSNADQVSEKGAKTVYQVIPETRVALIKKYGVDPYESPQAAAMGAGYLLKESLQRNNGDVASAVGEYIGGTDRANWGKTTQAYINRVMVAFNQNSGGSGGSGGGGRRLTDIYEQSKPQGAVRPDTIEQRIFESRLAGHSDDDIFKKIKEKDPRYKDSRKSGFTDQQIAEKLGLSIAAAPTSPKPKDYTGNRMEQFTDQAGAALGNAGRVIAGDGIIDAATAIPRAGIGGAQALMTGLGGMATEAMAGLYGLGAGAVGAAQGKDFAESATQGIESARATLQPFVPQPVIAPNTANAILGAMAIPMYGTEAAGQANYDAYGNPLSAAAVQGLGDAGFAALGFRGIGKAKPTATPQPVPRPAEPTPQPTAEPVGTPAPASPAARAANSPDAIRDFLGNQARPQPAPDTTPRPITDTRSGRIELTPENPDIMIQPDGTHAAPVDKIAQSLIENGFVLLTNKARSNIQRFKKIENGKERTIHVNEDGEVLKDETKTVIVRNGAMFEIFRDSGSNQIVSYRITAPDGTKINLGKQGIQSDNSLINETLKATDNFGNFLDDPIVNSAPANQPIRAPQGKAFTTDNTPVDFVYDVVPIESIQKSINADLTPNTAARPDLQPRNRDTDASAAQINEISNKLNPDRLLEAPTFDTGAPTIFGSEAVAGHGRLTAIERRYLSGRGADYKAAVTAKARELGIDPAKFEGIENPVLVRRLSDDATAVKVASDSNADTTLKMSVAEQARTDAKSLPDASKLVITENGEVNIAGSTDFVREFMRSMPTAARGDLMRPDGTLSQAGVRRIQAAIAQKAYNDATMIERINESLDDQGKRISAALVRNAGALVALADDVKAGARVENTLASDLAMAANKYSDIKASGSTVAEYMAQGRLVDDGMTPGALEALQVFGDNARSGKAVSEYIQGKIKEIEDQGNPSQNTLFQSQKPASQIIAENISKQVLDTGKYDADYAQAAGELAAAYYKATAAALGKTSQEVFDLVGLNIKSGEVDRGANAQISFGEKQHNMVFGAKANASSFVHELGHHFLETHAKLADQSPILKADFDTIMEWGGQKGRTYESLNAAQRTDLHEKFAETFEQYLLTGKAPTAKLKQVFEKFKTWMESVYESLVSFGETNPRAKLSPDITNVLDNMLGNKADARANAAREAKKSEKADAELLDFKRSAPADGGVSPRQQQSRYNVLRAIGLTEGQIRGGAVTGDSRRMGWDSLLAKSDTEAGRKMKQQMELESDKLREYGDDIVKSTGGTVGAAPEVRGAAILKPLEAYKDWYKDQIKKLYEQADKKAKATGGIELADFQAKLRENSFFARDGMRALRKGIGSWLKEQELVRADGSMKPMSAKQAESLRQYINSQYDYSIASGIRTLNDLIDGAVFRVLGENMYAEARKMNADYHRIFTEPKGMAALLEADGINRKTSVEKVGARLGALAETDVVQFEQIVKQLESMPTKALQADAKRAIGEIRAQIAEKLTAFDPTRPETPYSISKSYAPFRGGKLNKIFGKETADKLRNYVAASGVLRRVDPNPSGTASIMQNLKMRGAEVAATGAGTAAGGAMGGLTGATIGGVLGQQLGRKLQNRIIEAADQRAFDKAMSPKQFETMRQTMRAKAGKLENSRPVQDAIRESQSPSGISERMSKILNSRILRSAEWKAYFDSLSDADKAKIKQVGALSWLTSLGADQGTPQE